MKITFYPKSKLAKEVVPKPIPVTAPDWFKQIPLYNHSNELEIVNGTPNYSAKVCVPFTDSFQTGYVFTTWSDIQVKKVDDQTTISWGSHIPELNLVDSRATVEGFPTLKGFQQYNLTWISHWGIKTPKGYSCIFTHPFNRYDLPFQTVTGIMDTDKWGIWGNQPFSLQEDWEGIIPKGTPIIQVIPFKRESWTSEVDDSLTEWANYENIRRGGSFRGHYKRTAWTRKSFK